MISKNVSTFSNSTKVFFKEKTKLEYALQLRHTSFIKGQVMVGAYDVPYYFKCYESSTSQSKKQYNTYITYCSKSRKKSLTSNCGSFFVGHCTANQLDHFLCL